MGERGFSLPKGKKVTVKPVMRSRGLIKDPNHEAFFLFANSTIEFGAPKDKYMNLICPLTEEEREFFEDKERSGMSFNPGDLSPFKETNNFWDKTKFRYGKDEKTLDLGNPRDYIEYKVLIANRDKVAPSYAERGNKKTYRFMIVSEDSVINERRSLSDKKKSAYKLFAKMDEDRQKMLDFLTVYGKRVDPNSKIDFLVTEIDKIVENDLDGFLKVAEDKNLQLKLLIEKAVEYGIINKDGRKYFLNGGDPLAAPGKSSTIENVVEYLEDKSNQDIKLHIQAQVNAAKD